MFGNLPTTAPAPVRKKATGRRYHQPSPPSPAGLGYSNIGSEVIQHDFEAGDGEIMDTGEEKPDQANEAPGSLLEIKRVDEVYDRHRCEWIARDSIVPKVKRPSKDPYGAYAFTVNRRFNPTPDPTLHTITTTLDIKSEFLRKIGAEVIGQVQGVTWTTKPLKVR